MIPAGNYPGIPATRENAPGLPGSYYVPETSFSPLNPLNYRPLDQGSAGVLGSFGRTLSLGRSAEGGSGGGSEDTEGNMDPNLLIGLNPYLDKNVTSFSHGGKHRKSMYDEGGQTIDPTSEGSVNFPITGGGPNYIPELRDRMAKYGPVRWGEMPEFDSSGNYTGGRVPINTGYDSSGNRRQRITNEGYVGPPLSRWGFSRPEGYDPYRRLTAEDNEFQNIALENFGFTNLYPQTGNQFNSTTSPYRQYFNGGQVPAAGQYERQANQMIALNQLSNVFRGLQQRQGSMLVPQANKGMRIPRYNKGGKGNIEITDKTTGETKRISSKSQEYKDLMPDWHNPDQSPLQNLMFNPYRPAVGEWHDTETGERGVHSSGTTWGDIMPERFPNYVSGSSPSWWSMEDQYAPIAPPMANKGMKMRKRYTQGGRF